MTNTAKKRELSQQAQAAKMIKDYCKTLGVKCSARSDSFSMGDSVNWEVKNVDPVLYAQIKKYADQFQYGHFNGMDDYYEISNKRSDLPQTKYCFGSNEFDDELYQAAWELLKASAANGDGMPDEYNKAKNLQWSADHFAYDDQVFMYVRKILNGYDLERGGWIADLTRTFWNDNKQCKPSKPAAVGAVSNVSAAAHVEQHRHTKKNFDFWIVVLAERVTRDQFSSLLDDCKSAGGWYSRKWGSSPAGFAFREQADADQFAAALNTGNPENPENTEEAHTTAAETGKPSPVKSADEVTATRLRKVAEGMQAAIDDKFKDRLTNTPKRLAQAMHARTDGERLQRTQAGLFALADLHLSGQVPADLQHVKTKADAYTLAAAELSPVSNGFHSYHVDTGKPARDTAETRAFWALLTEKTEEEKAADKIRQMTNDLQFSKIPGYFPTPDRVIGEMLGHARIQASDRVLEPSAGHGAICEHVEPLCAEVKALEINYSLAKILSLKGYLLPEAPQNFMNADPAYLGLFDKVLMNPPFENLQDLDHVMHAFKFLKPGGRLVAIVSPSGFFRSGKKAESFRAWFEMMGGESYDIEAGAFKESGTQIATKMIVIDKPAMH